MSDVVLVAAVGFLAAIVGPIAQSIFKGRESKATREHTLRIRELDADNELRDRRVAAYAAVLAAAEKAILEAGFELHSDPDALESYWKCLSEFGSAASEAEMISTAIVREPLRGWMTEVNAYALKRMRNQPTTDEDIERIVDTRMLFLRKAQEQVDLDA